MKSKIVHYVQVEGVFFFFLNSVRFSKNFTGSSFGLSLYCVYNPNSPSLKFIINCIFPTLPFSSVVRSYLRITFVSTFIYDL